MTRYTIQCAYTTVWVNTVEVEADTVEEACEKAIVEVNNREGGWDQCDDAGPTYVERIATDAEPDNAYTGDLVPTPPAYGCAEGYGEKVR